jgi:hypothetical protein
MAFDLAELEGRLFHQALIAALPSNRPLMGVWPGNSKTASSAQDRIVASRSRRLIVRL